MNHLQASPHRERAAGAGATLLAGETALADLPLWAQVLVAARLLQRAALTLRREWPVPLGALVDAAIAAMHDCAREGGGVHRLRDLIDAARNERGTDAATAPVRGLLWYALDALRAAEAAQDFPVDATVTQSTLRALRELCTDARVVPLQLRVLMAGDIDLLRFACTEAGLHRYAALPDAVFLQLAQAHALTLIDPPPAQLSWR